jgi:type I restriction enzyme S subunit
MKLETFFKKYELFADAPDAVEKMRELVLELSASGRLIPEALERPVEEDTKLMGTIVELVMGQAPAGDSYNTEGRGTVFVKVGEFGELYPREEVWTTNPLKFAKRGDVLVCVVGATVGKLNLAIDCAIGRSAAAIRPSAALDTKFLYYSLIPYTLRLRRNSRGSAQGVIGKAELNAVTLWVPSRVVQKRTVAKVDELMALCDRLEAQQQKRETLHAALARASLARFADAPTPANLPFLFHPAYAIPPADLRKSILNLAFQGKLVRHCPNDEPAEELFARIESTKEMLIKQRTIKRVAVDANPSAYDCESLPPGWLWTRLGNSFDVRDGTHDTPKYTTEGFPLITSKNIYSGSLLFDDANLISETDHRQISERSRVDRGDILFAMIGSIGNPVIVDTDREFSIKNVALFKYYSAADSEPRFLLLYLMLVADEMKAKAAGGVQSFVSLGFLRNYLFPLPPLAEQRRIVTKVEQLMALVDALETQLAASRLTAANLLSAVVAELTIPR